VARPRFELLLPAAILTVVLASAIAAIRGAAGGAASLAAGRDDALRLRRGRFGAALESLDEPATADRYVARLRDALLEVHPALAEVSREQFAARSLDALRAVVAEERTTAARAAVDELALQRAFGWDALCADWLGEGGGDDDPRVDARVDLLADALLEAAGDPFTQRLRGDHFFNLSKILESLLPSAVGLFLDRDSGGVFVRAVLRDSDAAAKGLRVGDRILAIDGEEVAGHSLRHLGTMVAHPCRVLLTRAGFEAPVELDLFAFDPARLGVRGCRAAGDVGYLSFALFDGEVLGAVLLESRRLLRDGARALVLDLRGNLGGLIVEAVAIANLFLPAGVVVTRIVERGERRELPEEYESGTPAFGPEIPLVVLVDRSSASASELVAGALKDHHRALLVGEPTFGKGIGQTLLPLPLSHGVTAAAGSLPRFDMVWLTSLRFLSPNGVDHHGVGIAPDLVASRPPDSRGRTIARARRLADGPLLEALAELELSEAELDLLARPGPPPAKVAAAAAARGGGLEPGDDEREALKDAARLALLRRHPRLAACPDLDPPLAKAIEAARFALRRAQAK
jgi:carboxyl-terminal processing protease